MADELHPIDRAALPAFGRLDEWFGMALVEPSRGLRLFEHLSAMFKTGALAGHITATLARRAALTPAQRLEEHRQRKMFAVELLQQAAMDDGGTMDMGTRPDGEPFRCAVICLSGTLMKSPGSMDEATSTVYAREQVKAAAADAQVDAILIHCDSPGGYVSGTEELAAAIRDAAAKKPVMGYVEDLCASAAYWCLAGCPKIYANNATAQVGSIGVVMAFYEAMGMAGMQGLKPVVIATGEYKGMGFPGTEITPQQRAKLQESVDQTMEQFVAVVAAGRKLPAAAVRALGTGEVWGARDAAKKGLIDGIASYEQVLAKLGLELKAAVRKQVASGQRSVASGRRVEHLENMGDIAGAARVETTIAAAGAVPAAIEEAPQPAAAAPGGAEPNEERAMSTPTTAPGTGPKAASLQELKAALPNSTAEFRESCLEKGLTMEQAAIAFAEAQTTALEEARAKAKVIGTTAVREHVTTGGVVNAPSDLLDPRQARSRLTTLASQIATATGKPRHAAFREACRQDPEAHKALVVGHNLAQGRKVQAAKFAEEFDGGGAE